MLKQNAEVINNRSDRLPPSERQSIEYIFSAQQVSIDFQTKYLQSY